MGISKPPIIGWLCLFGSGGFFMYLTYLRGACLALVLGLAQAAAPYPTVPLKDLPDGLRFTFQQLKPEMNEFSHCAAAWDSQTDGDRMAFKCSIYIKMSAEGERRSMQYCEEKRLEKKIKAPCRLVLP
jgi:hypothetical protein